MKTWKKALLTSATLGAAALTLAACGSDKKDSSSASSSAKTTVKLWVDTDAKKSYTQTVKDFEKANKGVKVEIKELEAAKAQENVKKDPSKAADVFALPHDQLGQLVDAGVIQEIPAKYADKIAADDSENAVSGAQYKGKSYAFPYGIETQVLYYNKTKLTADDVKTYESITEKGKFGANLKDVDSYKFGSLFMSVGDKLYGDSGEDLNGTNWNNEAGVNVLKWVAAQKTNPGFVQAGDDLISKFGEGKITAFESGPWDKAKAAEAIGKDKLGIAVYPKMNIGGTEVQQKAFLGVRLYAVNQAAANGNTAQIAAAYKLADYISSAASQENQFKDQNRNIIPANKAIQNKDYVKNDALASAVVQMSAPDYSVIMPKIPEMVSFWPAAKAVISDTYNGKIPADQYQAKLDQLVKDISGKK
ncbi:extracellular solute-binding protein [Lactococcus insecticola]|uniref:Maltose ABC transporter substrate-binding protein n=1 Tax=Pseudolactococcus insecticola TaxID=2709158 RepID=A0A6A0B618_9LACT|nr:extracellular solute-binding protein [Lactococcus insecticola]GFH40133.1 maltose ABC transporter substrate-binding protein [Lactococcus insecticola]